jgi:hypothetical protein
MVGGFDTQQIGDDERSLLMQVPPLLSRCNPRALTVAVACVLLDGTNGWRRSSGLRLRRYAHSWHVTCIPASALLNRFGFLLLFVG